MSTAQCLERKFTRPTQISKHLYCSICTEVFLDPIRMSCSHTFCKKCIDVWKKNNNSCPVCRTNLESSLAGKDLIAEKIIQDLEVYCVNKLCNWKDRLENLNKHVKNCPFAKPPEWLSGAQAIVPIEENVKTDIYLEADDQYIERVNELIPRKSFLERLYTKSAESQKLVNSVFNNKAKAEEQEQEQEDSSKNTSKSKGKGKGKGRGRGKGKGKSASGPVESLVKGKSFEDYDDFLCALADSDDETKDGQTMADESKKESLTSKQDGSIGNIEALDMICERSSTEKSGSRRSSGRKKDLTANVEEEEIESTEHYVELRGSGGKRAAGRGLGSEPNKIKKSKTACI